MDFLSFAVLYFFDFQPISGPLFIYDIAEYKTTVCNVSDFNFGALVDGEVTAHKNTCTTTSATTGGELVTWTIDLQNEFYIHALRIFSTGCGELGNELPVSDP
mgnify:FL=1